MKTKIQKVQSARSTVDLSSQFFTTSNIGWTQPVFSREVIPSDKFNVLMHQINRCDALPLPSYVYIKNRLDAFYVKYSQVWKPFDAFIDQAPYATPSYAAGGTTVQGINVIPSETPYVSLTELVRWFTCVQLGLTQAYTTTTISGFKNCYNEVTVNHTYDFMMYATVNDNAYGFKFTEKGRAFYKLLYALGYRIPFVVDNTQLTDYNKTHMSLLPLMAYMSVKLNYFTPLKFRDYSFVNALSYLVDPVPTHLSILMNLTPLVPEVGINSSDLKSFVLNVVSSSLDVYYGDDYFTDSPISVYGSYTPAHSFHDPVSDTYSRAVVSPGTPPNTSFTEPMIRADVNNGGYSATNNWNLTQYLVYALKAVTSEQQIAALTKNDLVAATTSLFGYKPEVADMCPYYLHHNKGSITVSPITAVADSSGAPLGFKAGEAQGGLIFGKFDKRKKKWMPMNFDFETYGQFLILSSVSPDYFYTEGINREMLHTTKELIFDKNMARLGYQAVGQLELSLSRDTDTSSQDVSILNSFGFQSKYAEYAHRKDSLGGAFCIPTQNNGLEVMHFARGFDYSQPRNDKDFLLARDAQYLNTSNWFGQAGQFHRIFEVQAAMSEPIQTWCIFDIKATRDIVGKNDFTIGDDYNGQNIENDSLATVQNM